MTLKDHLNNMDKRKYFRFLVPATLIYFFSTAWWQGRLKYPPTDLDPYPGIPLLPEPYEIPLYVLGYLIIPLMALLFYYLWQFKIARLAAYLLISASIIAVVWFARRIDFPGLDFIFVYLKERGLSHALWLIFTKRIYVLRVAFAFAVSAFLIVYYFRKPQSSWVQELDSSRLLKKLSPYFFIILALIIFHPNFPSAEGFTNYGLLPAHEILHGKPLLYETSTQYGIFNTYLVAFIMRFVLPLSYQSFSLMLMFLYFGFYLALYKLLKLWFGSNLFAFLGVWVGVVVGFFLLTDPYITAFDHLGQTIYRQGFYILPALLVLVFSRNRKTFWRELLLLTSAASLFWSIDTGIYINIATFATLAYLAYPNFRAILTLVFRQFAYILVFFGSVNLINYLVYGSLPNWSIVLNNLLLFASGLGKIPLPKIGIFEIYVLVYLFFLSWIFFSLLQKRKLDLIIVFLTVYGIFSLLYYVGNSAWSYLNMTALPMLLLLLYVFLQFFKKQEEINKFFSSRLITSTFYAFLGLVLVLSAAKLPVVFAYRDYSQISLTAIAPEDNSIYQDALYIKENFPQTRIPLFHENIGKLLIMADKVNYFYVPYRGKIMLSFYDNSQILFRDQVQSLTSQVQDGNPEYIFITKQKDERVADFESFITQRYNLEKFLNTLKIYKRK